MDRKLIKEGKMLQLNIFAVIYISIIITIIVVHLYNVTSESTSHYNVLFYYVLRLILLAVYKPLRATTTCFRRSFSFSIFNSFKSLTTLSFHIFSGRPISHFMLGFHCVTKSQTGPSNFYT